jgi:hypothetical protein
MKKFVVIVLFVFGLVQIPAQTNSLPNNGKGVRFGVLLPVGTDLPENEKWILSYSQAILTNNFSQYTAMTIIDKQNIDKIIDEQIKSLSGNYSDETAARIGHLLDSEYDLYGTIKKIPGNQYTVNFSVSNKETGQRIASFLENTSLLQIHRTTILNKACANIIEQMGIILSTTNRQTLLADQSENIITAQSSLARGITAERSGANIEALSYYMQAATLNSSSAEINTRLNSTSQKIFTGDLKSSLQNEVQQKRAWLQVLNDCAKAYDNIIPFQLEIGRLRVGNMDIVKETQEFTIDLNIQPVPASMKLLENVLEEYLKIGYEKMLAYGFIDQNLRGWPNFDSSSNASLPSFHKNFSPWPWTGRNFEAGEKEMEFNIVVALVNENGKEFRQKINLTGKIRRSRDHFRKEPYQVSDFPPSVYVKRDQHPLQYVIAYVLRDTKGELKHIGNSKDFWIGGITIQGTYGQTFSSRRLTFNIPADDLTNKYTIKLISINGIDADIIALNGYMRTIIR